MSNNMGDKRILSMFLILVSLFIFIFFTRGYYSELIENMEINDSKKNEYIQKEKDAQNLAIIQKELKSIEDNENSEDASEGNKSEFREIEKYLQIVTEDEIIKEIYSSASRVGSSKGQIKIQSLSMTEGVKNELGFMESKITISARVKNKESMESYLDYLVKESKYKFFIDSFTIPKISSKAMIIAKKELNITIPITVFYANIK